MRACINFNRNSLKKRKKSFSIMNTTFHSSNLNSESDFFSVKLPEYRKPKLELWAFMSLNDIDSLLACFESSEFLTSIEHKKKQSQYKNFTELICQQLELSPDLKKDQILIDKYYYIVVFSLNNNFNKEQINCLLLIVKRTHELAIETSFGNLDEAFDYFKKLLVLNSVHRPPYSVHMFSMEEVTKITEYVFDVYFKQFKFYKYVFSLAVRLNLKFKYSDLPVEPLNEIAVDTSIVKDDTTKDFISDRPDANESSETFEAEQKKSQDELKDFIRTFLGDKINKMKDELNNELNPKPHDKSGRKSAIKKK